MCQIKVDTKCTKGMGLQNEMCKIWLEVTQKISEEEGERE